MSPAATLQLLRPCDVTLALTHALTALLAELVTAGSPLGWVEPPGLSEVGDIVESIAAASELNDAAGVLATSASVPGETSRLVGFGFWQRYARPTHQPQADLPLLAIAQQHQGRGTGGAMLDQLVRAARLSGVEQLTLDSRGDNRAAHALWRSRGFTEYGRLPDFVAVGDARYDKTFWVLDVRTEPGGSS